MKRLILLFFLMFGIIPSSVQAMSMNFAADTVKVGFQKDTIRILEGKSQIIVIELNGVLPKDSTVDVKWSIIDSDATADKDYVIIGDEKLAFSSIKAAVQEKYFKISTFKDTNVENEKFVIELSYGIKGKTFSKLMTKKCVIILEDFKTDSEIFNDNLESTKKEFNAQNKQILEKLSEVINKDKDTSEVIGTLRLKNSIPTQQTWGDTKLNKGYKKDINKKTEGKKVEISKVVVQFKYGVASEIRAFTKDSSEIFSNHWYNGKDINRPRYGVSYRHNAIAERNKSYYLIGENNVSSFIKLVDLLEYKHITGLNFVPSDTIITLLNEKGKKEADIKVNTSLSSYINFNIYTDLLGLLRIDQGNGIIQSDVSAKIYLTTLPARNKLRFHFNYIMPYARYARFENGFQNVPNTKNESFVKSRKDTMDRMTLNQRKFFDVGLKINILNKIGKFDNTYEINAFTGFGWFRRQGPVDDVLTQKVGITQYQGFLSNTFEFGLEARAAILQYRNFGINTGMMATYQRIINAKINGVGDGSFKPFFRNEAEIFYYPIANSKDKIFFRTYHTFSANNKEESFLRVQVGYKALFKISNKK